MKRPTYEQLLKQYKETPFLIEMLVAGQLNEQISYASMDCLSYTIDDPELFEILLEKGVRRVINGEPEDSIYFIIEELLIDLEITDERFENQEEYDAHIKSLKSRLKKLIYLD